MGKFSQARVTIGCVTDATLTAPGSSGSAVIGESQNTITYDDDDLVSYSLKATMLVGSSIALSEVDGPPANDLYSPQIRYITCAGNVTGSGNAKLTITGAALPTPPIIVTFAVTSGNTPATWIEKALAALKASSAGDYYSFSIDGLDLKVQPKVFTTDDSTLNLAIANDTCTGITPVAISTVLTAASGRYIERGDWIDFEGDTLPSMGAVRSMHIKSISGAAYFGHDGYTTYIPSGAEILLRGTRPVTDITFYPIDSPANLLISYVCTESAHGTAIPAAP